MSNVPDPSDDSAAQSAAMIEIVRKPKRIKKSEDPERKALKKKYDDLLAKFERRMEYINIEVVENKLKLNHVRGLRSLPKSWSGKIAIKDVDGVALMLTEAAW